MGGKALPYDAEIEYLEGTGTQYIDTGYKNWTTSVYIYSEVAFTSTSGRQLEGSVNSFYVGCNAGRVEAMFGNYFDTIQADTKIILEKSMVKSGNNVSFTIKKDGYTGYTRTQAYNGNEILKNIAFFNLIDNTSLGMKCKKYANKLIIDGVLVRDFVPVRKGTTGYMYDKVSGELFGNNGTGSFILGPDKKLKDMKRYYNPTTNQWYTEGTSLTRKIENGVFSGIPSEQQLTEWGFVEWVEPAPTPEELLARAKSAKIAELEAYDASDAVNSFSVNGVSMWVPADKRAVLRTSIEAYKALGAVSITKVWEGQEYTFPITDWDSMLNQVEVYASECFNQTQRHAVAIQLIDNIEDLNNYDFTTDYPDKLIF